MDSVFIHNEACPACRENGKDRAGDNLAVYSDGHKFCYSCGYREHSSNRRYGGVKPTITHKAYLPIDCELQYSHRALEWIQSFGLCRNDLLKHRVLYSYDGIRIKKGHCDNLLIFPVFGQGEDLLGYSARYFGNNPDIPKWIIKGKLSQTFHIIGEGETLVLTEDVVSAIKVVGHAHDTKAMPLYGINAKNRWDKLFKLGYRNVILWLDPDMKSESIRQIRNAHGLNVRIVYSDKDPKYHTPKEIREYLR